MDSSPRRGRRPGSPQNLRIFCARSPKAFTALLHRRVAVVDLWERDVL